MSAWHAPSEGPQAKLPFLGVWHKNITSVQLWPQSHPCKVQPHRGSGKPQVHCTLTAQGRLGLSFGQTNWKRQVMREWGPASRCVGAPEPGLGSHKAQRGLSCCSSEKASCWVSLPLWAGPLGAAATQLAKCLCGRRWQQSPWLFQDAPTRDSRGGQASA